MLKKLFYDDLKITKCIPYFIACSDGKRKLVLAIIPYQYYNCDHHGKVHKGTLKCINFCATCTTHYKRALHGCKSF